MTVAVPEVERPLDLNRRGTSSWRALEPHILPALIVALAAVLRFHGLGQQSVWFDEAASAHVAQTPWRDFLVTLRQSEITPPLYYLLLKGWMFFFGTSEFSIRAPSAIFGIVSVWLMYDLARRILGRTEGLIAAFLLCISKFHIEYSHEARSYALLMMLALWSCIEFLRLFQQPTRRSEVRYWIATILMLYAHLYGVFVVAAQNIGYLALLAARLRGRPLPSYRPQQWFSLQMVLALGYTPCLILIN